MMLALRIFAWVVLVAALVVAVIGVLGAVECVKALGKMNAGTRKGNPKETRHGGNCNVSE